MATPSIPSVGHLPSLEQLKHEAKIQEEVQARLKHLVDNAKPGRDKIKSQRGGSVEVFIANRIKWPHEYVLSGNTKDRITYNQLSPIQWMAGFCRTIREESDPKNKEFMLDYVINVLDDATDFSWASAKACHAVLLCRMEQGEIQSWYQTDKIDRIRRAHAQRHITGQGSRNRSQDKSTYGTGRVVLCIYFNKGMCMQKQTYETKGVLYKHICSSCWSKEGKSLSHSQLECRKLQTQTKNE